MSELTITAIRLGVLVLMWAFIFSIVGVLRSDLYGGRVVSHNTGGAKPVANPERSRARTIRKGPTHLAVTEGSMRGITVPLSEAGVLIGRNPECALVLSDDFASGRHARIYRQDDQWFVDDLGSTNGTYVNGERITAPVKLTDNSQVSIGQTVLEVRK